MLFFSFGKGVSHYGHEGGADCNRGLRPPATFCAFLGAGCSDSNEETANATPTGPNPTLTPLEDYTQEQIAAMKDAPPSKEAQVRLEAQQAVSAATARPDRTIIGKLIETTPTPAP